MAVCMLLMFGMYPLLSIPLEAPRAMYGVGAFIAFPAVSLVSYGRTWGGRFCTLALTWAFFVFSFTYGNALAQQKQYTEFRVQEIVEDLSSLEVLVNNTETVKLQIRGNIGQAPALRNMPHDYTMLDSLVPRTLDDSWDWSLYYFYNYFDLKNVTAYYGSDYDDAELEELSRTMYHTIYGNDEYILVELN